MVPGQPIVGVQLGQLAPTEEAEAATVGHGRWGAPEQFVMQVATLRGQRLVPEGAVIGCLAVGVDGALANALQQAQQALGADPGMQAQMFMHGAGFQAPAQYGRGVLTRCGEGVLEHVEAVQQAVGDLHRGRRAVPQALQARAQGQQHPGQVAAVHRGHIARWQGLQALGVVPVVEVPAIALQPAHAGEHPFQALQQPAAAQVAEVMGRQVRQQGQAQVGGGRAMGYPLLGLLLQVVRGQPVVLGADVLVEKGPGAAGQALQETPLARVGHEGHLAGGAAQPPGQGRAGQPGQQQGHGHQQLWARPRQPGQEQRQGRADPHPPVELQQAVIGAAFGFPGRLPLQAILLADAHAP